MQWRIFAVTWLAYAGFYLCRKNLSVAMPLMMEDLGLTKVDFAIFITGYSLIYMLGQFANGLLSDRWGPRLIVGMGLVISVCSNVFMGFGSSLLIFGVLHCINGYGQSTGWSGTVKNMSSWFDSSERGVVMAWWATCYALGGSIATVFATYVSTNETFFVDLGWRRAFFAPSIALACVAVAFIVLARNKPSDAGLPDIVEDEPDRENEDVEAKNALRLVLSNPAVWITAVMYFFLKMMRYSFLYWLPLYMTEALGYTPKEAGYTSSVYEWVGFTGVIFAGYVSDKFMQSRRFPVSSIMLFCLAIACFFYPKLAAMGLIWNVIGIAFVGIMTFGPDALMTGAAAMDMGSQRAAGTAAGFINGVGSMGQLLSPMIVALVADSAYGWNGLFSLFVVTSLIGSALLATKWNYLPAKAQRTN